MKKTAPHTRATAVLVVGCLAVAAGACKPKPAEVRISPKKTTVYGFGKKAVFAAEVVDPKGNSLPEVVVTWESSNAKAATIDAQSGILKSIAAGKTTVTARVADSPVTGTATAEVIDLVSASMAPTRTTLAGPAGTSFTFSLRLEDSKGQPVNLPAKWTSGDPKILSVDSSGKVTSVGEGSTAVTAMIGETGASAEVRVVFKEIASLELSPATIPLKVGELGKATLVARDPSGQPIPDVAAVWTSGDPKVATVAGGQVLGIGAGSTVIRAVCGGKTAEVSTIVY